MYIQHIQGLCQSRLSPADHALPLVAPAITAVKSSELTAHSWLQLLGGRDSRHRLEGFYSALWDRVVSETILITAVTISAAVYLFTA
jgi:hypothetical protein